MHSVKSIHHALLATSLLGCLTAQADPSGLLVGKFKGESAYDKAWSAATLYKDEANPILQEFSLQGQFQIQYADGASSTKDYNDSGRTESVWGEHFDVRRARFGFKSKWFQDWKFDAQINVDMDGHDDTGDNTLYRDLYECFVTYAPSDAFNISAGKIKVKFSRDQEISSKETLPFDHAVVSNLLFPGELTGVWASGKGIADHWLYEAGIYGNDRVREFSGFSSGAIFLGKVGYDYSKQVGLDTAVASFHYMHNTQPDLAKIEDPRWTGSSTPAFTDSIALTNDITQGRFGLTTDVLYGFGDANQSDVFGICFIPSYFIADGLQLVGRLQFASAAEADGFKLPGRYEGAAPTTDGAGNTYTSAYVGLNYYFYSHKLKLMNGLEYSHLGGGDYDGTTFLSGLRFSF
jgi:phosphate-selective porin OprO and OprP